MEQENVMMNDGRVTLVGFGSAKKIESRPKKEDLLQLFPDLDCGKNSFYSDISAIYLLMNSLLLKDGYSAFYSFVIQDDADQCDESSTSSEAS